MRQLRGVADVMQPRGRDQHIGVETSCFADLLGTSGNSLHVLPSLTQRPHVPLREGLGVRATRGIPCLQRTDWHRHDGCPLGVRVTSEKVEVACSNQSIAAPVHTELAVQAEDVSSHGVLRYDQLRRDFGDRGPASKFV